MNKILSINAKQTMTLKEITDLLNVRHNDAMKTVTKMAESIEFGNVTRIPYRTGQGNEYETYQLDKRQSLAVSAKLNTDLLMRVIDRWQELENMAVKQAPLYLPPQTIAERLTDISTSIDILERIGMLDDRDRLHYADSVRNAGMALVPQSTEVLPVTISSRVVELHKKANAGELQKIGKLVVKMYKDIFDSEPLKHTQYVQGAARQVNSYTTEHLDIIDSAINDILG